MVETLYINEKRVNSHFVDRPRLCDTGVIDSLERALALRADLEIDGLPDATAASALGSYVKAEGAAWLFAPGDTAIPEAIEAHEAAINALLDERWQQARTLIDLKKEDTYWALVLEDCGQLVAAAIIDGRHLSENALSSYRDNNSRWAAFGLLEKVVEEIPLLTVIYAWYIPGG